MTRPIIIDTDPGIDDALALMLAAASPEVNILGLVAVAGNIGIERTFANTAALADLLRLDVPVGYGAAAALAPRAPSSAAEVHGADGLGGYHLPISSRRPEPGVPLMTRLIEESGDPVTVVAIGPLTNLAQLITAHPRTARTIERIVIMGGGTHDVTGNITPAAEFNMYSDPEAAALVFGFGVPITMIGLNVTQRVLVGRAHLTRLLSSGGPIAELVGFVMDNHFGEASGADGLVSPHDVVAMASVIDPTLVGTRLLPVDIETGGAHSRGATIVDFRDRGRAGNADVALEVDVTRVRELIDTRLAGLDTVLRTP